MTEALSLRLDRETLVRIERLAKRRGATRSAVLREAIVEFVDRAEGREAVRPYDLAADLIGSIRGGDPERSVDVGRKVARLLAERRSRSKG